MNPRPISTFDRPPGCACLLVLVVGALCGVGLTGIVLASWWLG